MIIAPASAEVGDRWEILRKYCNPQTAQRAAEEIVWLETQSVPFAAAERPKRRFDGTKKITVVQLMIEPPRGCSPESYLKAFPQYRHQLDTVVRLWSDTRLKTHDTSGGVLGHIYERGGRMGWHRDRADLMCADDSLSINLRGECHVGIKDPTNGKPNYFVLNPGDAVYINNEGMPRGRPSHMFVNHTNGPRISMVD